MAAQFSGTSWYLTSTTLALDNPRRFTALLWHYQTTVPSLGAYNGIFSIGVSSGACAQLYNIGMGSSTFDFGIYDGTNFDETSGPAYAQATWNHVALVYDGTLQLWVNGAFSFSITGAVPGNGIEIGNDSVSTGFSGRLDDIRIYEGVALTQSQIQREMASRTPMLDRKYSMPFRFLNRQGDTDFTASDGRRQFGLTKTGTAVWGESSPVGLATKRRPQTLRRWGDTWSGGNQTATPGVATGAIAGASPTASGSGTGTATPGSATVALTGVSPTASGSGSATSTPGTATVSLTGVDLSASATGAATATAGTATVALTGASPTVVGTGTGTAVPGAATVSVAGISPTVAGSGTGTATSGTATVALSGASPTVSGSGTATATPGVGIVTLTGVDAAASGGGTQVATAGVATITLTAQSPSVVASGSVSVSPGTASVTLTGSSLSATASGSVSVVPGFAAVTILGISPTIVGLGTATVTPGVGIVTVTGVNVDAAVPSPMADVNPIGPFLWTNPVVN